MKAYYCNTCGAFFESKKEEECLQLLENHKENCEKEKPYIDDDNADRYMGVNN